MGLKKDIIMIRQVSILFLSIFLCGCSFIPRVTFDKANALPQQTEKSKKFMKCREGLKMDEFGRVTQCDKGFKSTENLFNQKERKLTMKEKVINFFANLKGILFWVVLASIIIFPSTVGLWVGNIFSSSSKALKATIRAIKQAKNNGKHISGEDKEKYDQAINDFMKELDKAHKDSNVKKLINKYRSEV
jgi:hypothetical protein